MQGLVGGYAYAIVILQLSWIQTSGALPGRSERLRLPDVELSAPWTCRRSKALNINFLLNQKHGMNPTFNAASSFLSRVPEMNAPVQAARRIAEGFPVIPPSAVTYLGKVNTMVENLATNLATPISNLVRLSEELARPMQGLQQIVNNIPRFWEIESFWEGLRPAIENFKILLEDVEAGREALTASEFGFAEHFWNVFFIRGFAHIDSRVRNAVVTNKLLVTTASDSFLENFETAVTESQIMNKRWRFIEAALSAHARRDYALAVPVTLAQIEGTLIDLMFVKDLVERDQDGRFYLIDQDGNWMMTKKDPTQRRGAITLGPAARDANLGEHPDLVASSEFLANILVQRRNSVLHGHDLTYDRAKFSVQAILLLAVLAEAVSELESGELN